MFFTHRRQVLGVKNTSQIKIFVGHHFENPKPRAMLYTAIYNATYTTIYNVRFTVRVQATASAHPHSGACKYSMCDWLAVRLPQHIRTQEPANTVCDSLAVRLPQHIRTQEPANTVCDSLAVRLPQHIRTQEPANTMCDWLAVRLASVLPQIPGTACLIISLAKAVAWVMQTSTMVEFTSSLI